MACPVVTGERLEHRRALGLDAEITVGTGIRTFAPAHHHCAWQLGVQLQGRARFWLSGHHPIELAAGRAIALPPQTVHAVEVIGDVPTSFAQLTLSEAAMAAHGSELPARLLCVEGTPARMLRELCLNSETDSSLSDLLRELLDELALGKGLNTSEVAPPPWLREIRSWIDEHPARIISLDELAAATGRSRFCISREFRRVFGVSLQHYQVGSRVNMARQVLSASSCTLAEAAELSGFSDQAHLTRMFRRYVGVPPGTWRRRMGFTP